MTNRFTSTLLLCLTVLISLSAQEEETWSPGDYMRQATDNTFEKASLMSALSEFSISNNLAMAGAIINVGSTIALDVELEAGKAYTFIGGGDEDVVDLDMYIVDINGEVVASDIEDDGTPIPDFTADYTGRYSLRLQLVSGEAPTSFVSFIMMTTDGNPISDEEFSAISDSFYDSGSTLNNVSDGIRWHDQENQWCLFGFFMDTNQEWEMENLRLGTEKHYLFSIGGKQSANIDLLLNDKKGQEVAIDTEEDAYPILDTNTSDLNRYTLNIKNVSSSGPAFILVGIVTE